MQTFFCRVGMENQKISFVFAIEKSDLLVYNIIVGYTCAFFAWGMSDVRLII